MTQKLLTPAAPVKVRLLQDAVYSEDEELWQLVQRYRQHLQDYFRELGLDMVVAERLRVTFKIKSAQPCRYVHAMILSSGERQRPCARISL